MNDSNRGYSAVRLHVTNLDNTPAPIHFLGTLSFETRCGDALRAACGSGKINNVSFISYSTNLVPAALGATRRTSNQRAISALSKECGAELRIVPIQPYQQGALTHLLNRVAEVLERDGGTLLVDISCMTGVHVVALASWLSSQRYPLSFGVLVSHSAPIDVETDATNSKGFQGLSLTPIVPLQRAEFVPDWRPLVDVISILGDDDRRVAISLAQLEVKRGLAIYQEDYSVDILARERILADMQEGYTASWNIVKLNDRSMSEVGQIVATFVGASDCNRVVITPFGPKPIILQSVFSALWELDGKPRGLWMSYAVPEQYNVAKRDNSGMVSFFSIEKLEDASH